MTKLTKALLALAEGCQRAFERRHGVCARCEGHGCVEVYDISDEYSVPCPRCEPEAFVKAARRHHWSEADISRDLAGRAAIKETRT